ncbi:MAG: hypothetical protein KIT84_08955 [Labilithrix sp.]|nr:hypothetical protein [Labilithrix sp.]MCW5811128.1 hypothetical protein [Labilithrix sp.]
MVERGTSTGVPSAASSGPPVLDELEVELDVLEVLEVLDVLLLVLDEVEEVDEPTSSSSPHATASAAPTNARTKPPSTTRFCISKNLLGRSLTAFFRLLKINFNKPAPLQPFAAVFQ